MPPWWRATRSRRFGAGRVRGDHRDAGALAGGGEVAADVGPWAEEEAVRALAVGQGVLQEWDGEADDLDSAIGGVGLCAAQAEDALVQVDVAPPGGV